MLCALIMAGGRGTRFWPISTEEKPKQFLNLIDEKTMLQITVERLLSNIDINHIFVCTDKKYEKYIRKQLPSLPKKNIIIEPCGRNTAPCILLSILYINQIYNDTNIVVLPSDHKINDESEFLNVINSGNLYIKTNKKAIVTIGIQPDRPETGYGYIKQGDLIQNNNSHQIMKVEQFVEKPNKSKAIEYLRKGTYLWNAGMFMFNSKFILKEFQKYYNKGYEKLSSLPCITSSDYFMKLSEIYLKCDAISIDYAIMEKSENIYVIPSDFDWDDLGSWKSIERYVKKDKSGNIVKGKSIILNSYNNLIYGTDKDIVLIDVDDLFCIESNDKIIIGKRNSIEKIVELRGYFDEYKL